MMIHSKMNATMEGSSRRRRKLTRAPSHSWCAVDLQQCAQRMANEIAISSSRQLRLFKAAAIIGYIIRYIIRLFDCKALCQPRQSPQAVSSNVHECDSNARSADIGTVHVTLAIQSAGHQPAWCRRRWQLASSRRAQLSGRCTKSLSCNAAWRWS